MFFGLFGKKDDKKSEMEKLNSQFLKLTEQARDLQRKGDIKGFAEKTGEAEAIMDKIVALKNTI